MRFREGDKVKLAKEYHDHIWAGDEKNPINEVGTVYRFDDLDRIIVKWENGESFYHEKMLKLYKRGNY